MSRFDVVIPGGGVNALVAANFLARGGHSVLVLEAADTVGGRAATDDFHPGFRGPATFAGLETVDPELIKALDLKRHGLKLLTDGGFFLPVPDGPSLFVPVKGAAKAIGQHNAGDGEAYAEFDRFLGRLASVFHRLLANPLPELEPTTLGPLMDLARPAVALRRLGAADLTAAMRFLPMPIRDVVEERFESGTLRAAVAGGALQGSWLAPRSPGSALNLLLHRCGALRNPLAFLRPVAGGPGALASVLEHSAKAAGAEIRTGARVDTITVKSGRVHGVVLEGGEEIAAGTVLSTLDPKTTFLNLLEPGHLDPQTHWRAGNIRSRGTVATLLYALDALPTFHGAPEDPAHLAGRIQVGATLDTLERAFDATKYGRLSECPLLFLTVPSVVDPTLAPPGKHVLTAWVQYPPETLREGTWETRADDLVASVESTLQEVCPGFTDHILARRLLTPADLAQRFGLAGGGLYHAEPALDQMLHLRPMPNCGRHDTPLPGLYLGGAGSHGGGPLTGLAGANAAQRVLQDLRKGR